MTSRRKTSLSVSAVPDRTRAAPVVRLLGRAVTGDAVIAGVLCAGVSFAKFAVTLEACRAGSANGAVVCISAFDPGDVNLIVEK